MSEQFPRDALGLPSETELLEIDMVARVEELKARVRHLREERDALAAEMDELRVIAERAQRAPTIEERQLAASIVCARLVRPPERQRDPDDAVIERSEREGMLPL